MLTMVVVFDCTGVALLPPPLRGATSSLCQKPNVPNISKDRFESLLKIFACWIGSFQMILRCQQNEICPNKLAISLNHSYFQKDDHKVFHPLAAACNYWRWGGSGSQENINAICILGLNIVNDKVRGVTKQQHHHSYCCHHHRQLCLINGIHASGVLGSLVVVSSPPPHRPRSSPLSSHPVQVLRLT